MPKQSKRKVDIEALEALRSRKLKERNRIDDYVNGITESILILKELEEVDSGSSN